MAEQKPKKKKPDWQKHMTVYFNAQDGDLEKLMYEYCKQFGRGKFSGFVKYLIYEYMKENPNVSPYGFIPGLEKQTVAVTVREAMTLTLPPRMEPSAPPVQQDSVTIKIGEEEKEYIEETRPLPKKEKPPVHEIVEEPEEEEEEVELEEETEEDEDENAGSFDFADVFANLMKQNKGKA